MRKMRPGLAVESRSPSDFVRGIAGQKKPDSRDCSGQQDREDHSHDGPGSDRSGGPDSAARASRRTWPDVVLAGMARDGGMKPRRCPWAARRQTVLRTLGAVVLRQLETKASGLDADGGVMLRIEIVRAPENLGRDLIFLQRRSGMIQRMLGQISKQFAQRFRPMKHMAVDELVDLSEVPLTFRTRRRV